LRQQINRTGEQPRVGQHGRDVLELDAGLGKSGTLRMAAAISPAVTLGISYSSLLFSFSSFSIILRSF